MYNFLKYSLVFLLVSSFFSCRKTIREKVAINYSYYPINIGHEITYLVDSIVYDDFTNTIKNFKYKIREVNVSSFAENAVRAEVFIAPNVSDSFQIKNAVALQLENNQLIRLDNNLKTIPLTFPISVNRKWNVNAQNNLAVKEAIINSKSLIKNFNNLTLDSICEVQYENDSNLIARNTELYYYAPGIGLVGKEIIHIESQNIIPQLTISNRATSGYKVIYTIEKFK